MSKMKVYRRGIYNLQTRTLTFPDQKKNARKSKLKIFKNAKT